MSGRLRKDLTRSLERLILGPMTSTLCMSNPHISRCLTLTPSSSSFEASTLASELSKHTIVPIPYKAPFNWALASNIAAVIVIGSLAVRVAYMYLGTYIFSRWTWALAVVLTMLTFTSSHMFVKIRGMPTTMRGQWIAGGYQNQYGAETTVISGICEYKAVRSGISTELFWLG